MPRVNSVARQWSGDILPNLLSVDLVARQSSFGVNGSYYKKIADFVDSSGYFLLIVFADVDQLMNKALDFCPKVGF
ncbi:hypothetical protein Q3G72_012747 [Acer saccharum]|nr:hypothetical protein Q3G72_012747 [Acer saccharum]